MKVLILNGGPTNGGSPACREIRDAVLEESRARGWEVSSFDLEPMEIKPCRGCFACWLKHPGTCAIKDDEEAILGPFAGCDALVWITPIVFGGYAPALKKFLDRSIPNALPLFHKVHGEIHHPQRYVKQTRMLVFGTLPAPDAGEERVFHDLVHRNSINLASVWTESRVIMDGGDAGSLRKPIHQLLDQMEKVG